MRLLFIGVIYGLFLNPHAFAVTNLLEKHVHVAQGPALTEAGCVQSLARLEDDLDAWDWAQLGDDEIKQIQIDAKKRMQESWQLRLSIHRRLGELPKECALKVRKIFHQLRDYEDYLSELAFPEIASIDPKSLEFQSEPVPIFDRKAYPDYFVRTDVDSPKFEFKSGDLMLARGVSFVSAIITQVSDNRSHFSHVVTVQVDPKTGAGTTVESYIGSGVEQFQLEFALKNENARLLVLRPKDAALGQSAAQVAIESAGQKLPYDYDMNYEEASAMSCVEVPVFAFAKASQGALKLPTYPASVTIKNTAFLERMGLRSGLIRTPDDLEIDPHFEMLLDWKDQRLVRDSRHKDAVLAEMVRWISDLNYQFHDNWKSYLAMYFLKPMRSTPLWPWIKKITGAPTIDKEVPRSTFGVMVLVDQLGEKLLAEVRAQDQSYRLKHGRPMTNLQLRLALENYRVRDLKSYTENNESAFHALVRGP